MPTQEHTTPRQVTAARRSAPRQPVVERLAALPLELLGYGLIWLALALFLWSRISAVDQFYLDEWIYIHGAQYIWENLPGGAIEPIPLWDRGPQRLYSTLMAPIWGLFGASTAFTLSHILNVVLLSSAVVPAALFARRVIDHPALRLVGVALAVAVPWLTIGSHLLAESLAFPLFLWAAYASVRAAEEPSLSTQLLALAVIAATALCRLNFATIFLVLLIAVLVAELRDRRDHRDVPFAAWARRALRREWPIVATACIGLAVAIAFVAGGSASFGRYGHVDSDRVVDRLVGGEADTARHIMVTYGRALVVGSFVMPFVLGLAVAFAGTTGRLGRRLTIPSVVALSGLIVTIAGVAVYTISNAPEERYVFVVCAPIALLAVAGLEHLDALRRWVIAAGAVTIWLLLAGIPAPGVNAGNFFAAPAGAFWTRVVDHRLRGYEGDLFGWLFIPATGWLLVALAIGALVAWIGLARPRPRLRAGVVVAGLVVCLAAQVAMLGYAFKQELYGTTDAPGGIALSDVRAIDREEWIDASLPDDVNAAVLPGVVSPAAPAGHGEHLSFWSKDLDATVAMPWNGSPVPAPPGYGVQVTTLGPNGLAAWAGVPPEWLVTQPDDPRVQFAGTIAARSPSGAFESVRLSGAPHAVWTAQGVDAGGGVPPRGRATLTLDRAQTEARAVVIALRVPQEANGPVRWRLRRDGRAIADGRLVPGATDEVTLRVPACTPDDACDPVAWELRPFGADTLRIDAARLGA
jgi:hypothetical protein